MKSPMSKLKLGYLNQHSKPVTRRDFVVRGLYGACGFAVAPTALGWLLQSQALADSRTAPPKTAPKFITFDLAGGAALFANFLVGGGGGPEDLLKNYDLLGWDPRASGALDRRFGLPMAANGVSKILTGLTQAASSEAQVNFRMGSFLHTGLIDSSDNPLSILSLVGASQLCTGSDLTSSLGLEASVSGGNSRPLLDLTTNRPFFVKDLNTLVHAVGLGGALQDISLTQKGRIGKLLSRLSTSQLTRFLGGPLSQTSFDYITSGVNGAPTHFSPKSEMDPRKDPAFQKIYNIQTDSDIASDAVLRAALVMNTLKGISGPCVITIGGCDYHDQTQTTGDAKDLEAGLEIGRAIEAAKQLKTPLFIHIITDGGIYPKAGTRIWTGDDVEKCMSIVGIYHPDQPQAPYVSGRYQIGAYTQAQGADRTTLVGSSAAVAANAAFANYLSVSGRMDLLSTVLPSSLSASTLEPTLLFGALS